MMNFMNNRLNMDELEMVAGGTGPLGETGPLTETGSFEIPRGGRIVVKPKPVGFPAAAK